ncbi:MAG TPA: SDR family oxidoreductase [Candidatus Angelobacter sp.]|nr:SDR family oxidoreductase [Candidatus Angelobacter sp.]
MQIQGKVVIVTGGANGIGRALCHRFAKEGAQAVIVADIDLQGTTRVADEINGLAAKCDVSKEPEIQSLVAMATEKFGRVDIFCSNAGIGAAGGPEAPNREWERSWEINVMAHIYAARTVLPQMLSRKEGYLLQTVSAAGLLTQIGSAPYSVTKHAALGFAEWLAVTYGDQGIRVSALCPQGVKTDMLLKAQFAGGAFLLEGALEPEQAADDVMKAIAEEKFLILPHPETAKYFQNKANDYERWIRGMRKLMRNSQPMKTQ